MAVVRIRTCAWHSLASAASCACSELLHANVTRLVDIFPIIDPQRRRLCVVTQLAGDGSLWALMEGRPPAASRVQVLRKSTWGLYPFVERAGARRRHARARAAALCLPVKNLWCSKIQMSPRVHTMHTRA